MGNIEEQGENNRFSEPTGQIPVGFTFNNQYFNIAYSLFPKNEIRFKGNIFLSSSDILS